MMVVLASIIGGIAVLAWGFALVTLIQLISLSPAGQKLNTLFDLGWWKFDAIRARIGSAAEPLMRNYVRAFLLFFVCVLLIAGVSILFAMERQNGAPAEETASEPLHITDPRVVPVPTADAVLNLPNSSVLES